MFLDNECASLLSEEPLRSEINLTARIFSAQSGKAFLESLIDRFVEQLGQVFMLRVFHVDTIC